MAALAGCYKPSIDPCQYKCNGETCPNELECTTDHWCAAAKTDRCSDVGGDGGNVIDARPDASCGWNVTNFDVCTDRLDQLGIGEDWVIPVGGTATINTDTGAITGSVGVQFPTSGYKMLKAQPGGGSLLTLVLGVHDLTVNGTINISGGNPIIIAAAGLISIGGTIHLDPDSNGTLGCNGNAGASSTGTGSAAGGGGGGSYGTAGGMGGTGSTALGANGELGGMGGATSPSDLVPIRGGCTGGKGGSSTNPANITGGQGGKGGNAIELSARTSIRFASGGTIIANGEGGHPTSGAKPSKGAGGGGGAGGGILLEAPTVDLTAVKLCANGGGGGASFANGGGGTPPTCTGPAMGGGSGGTPGLPGSGGEGAANASAAQPGAPGQASSNEGGGGGGGAHGKIRVLGSVTGTPVSVSPPITQ